ncbi:MAG TPA: ABC transporter ATP-binding protein [Phycisphaerales bacterium]|nr:ABC transporter ATP-binding protein [Phycisphaerales bacterium]
MSTVLSVVDAHKTYGETQALKGASITLNAGEWLGLLGPNGAGKTTLIRAIAGRVLLDQGRINLLGSDISSDRNLAIETRKRLGVVPQEIALYPLLTARENLQAFGTLSGIPAADLETRIEWALEWTGLADRAKDLAKTFSGGMKRRLNIACSVLHRPSVILLDEPTVGVDPQSRQRIWDMLAALRKEGAALLLTTHQLDEAQTVCDRITIIDHGRTIADGTMDQLVLDTIGPSRTVLLTLDAPPTSDLLTLSIICEDLTLRASMTDVAADLPPLLQRLHGAGRKVRDVQVQSPSLHSVFIHLTGRDLRE